MKTKEMKEISVLHIENSWKIGKRYMGAALDIQEKYDPDNIVLKNRSRASLRLEWVCHNFLYQLGIARERTAEVDLDYPQPWYMTAAYCICGVLVYPFTR